LLQSKISDIEGSDGPNWLANDEFTKIGE